MSQRWLALRTSLAVLLPLIPVFVLAAASTAPVTSPPSPPAQSSAPSPDIAKVTLSTAEVPAKGSADALLSVDRFGRYSVRVENSQGSSLELIDKMAGSLGKSGEAGRESGRLDLFLDRGQYKLLIESVDRGNGKAKLQARSFREKRGGALAAVPRLVETRLVRETLDDVEQISYWVEIGERTGVRLEAAGRNLADLRLWRDGTWLDGATPSCQAIQPVIGQPLLRCRLSAVLEPGLYLLTAYGGPGQPWAEGSDEHPFFLRWGEPKLPATGRRRYVVSPFGEDHFRLPDNVNFLRLELPEARPASLAAGWVRGGSGVDKATDNEAGSIAKESLPPAVEIRVQSKPSEDRQEQEAPPAETPAAVESPAAEDQGTAEAPAAENGDAMAEGDAAGNSENAESAGSEEAPPPEAAASEQPATGEESSEAPAAEEPPPPPARASARAVGPLAWELMARVSGTPGQVYILQHFEQRDTYKLRENGPHWVSSVHAGAAEDSVDATALLTVTTPSRPESFLTAAAIALDSHTAWSRRFNLLELSTLFLEIKETGRYQVVTGGTATRVRVEPFFLRRPEHYQPPDLQGASSAWDLDAGFYVLTLVPQKKGIVTLALRPEGKNLEAPPQPVQAAVRFAPITLDLDNLYSVYFNHQPGVTAGMVVRPWPLDLFDPLPVAQKPGEAFQIPFHVDSAQAGTLRAEAEDGSKLEISVDGGSWVTDELIAAGDTKEHTVAVRHNRLNTVSYSLWVEPAILQPSTPLPPLSVTTLSSLPKLPLLQAGAPVFLDLENGQKATYQVRADKPGLYAVRSTGLLATAGTLRTRTVPELRREEQNGVGRNFVVQQYLREGDYQVSVQAVGRSAGHLGLNADATQLVDGGDLIPGVPGHVSLPAGQAVVFHVLITEKGDYSLRALGLGFKFRCRFEDADGWPLEKPNGEADIEWNLDPGSYRFVLLPQPVDARALVMVERKPQALKREGHGPHQIPLEKPVENVWMEPEGSETDEAAVRPPDVWQFELPAKAHVAVELTEEMQGHLSRIGDKTEIAYVPPGRGWKGELEPGRYQVAAECSRRNSRVRYTVTLHTQELVTGLERTVQAPASVPVSVGKDGLVELTSISPADVRARLLDADHHTVVEGDDRPDDWNFLLFQRLAPGYYTLEVEPVAAKKAAVRVLMRTPAEVEQAALNLPSHGSVQLGSDVLVRPLAVGAQADLLLVAARSKDSLGLSIEIKDGSSWRTLGTSVARDAHLEVPVDGRSSYRLRLWSLDRHGTPVKLSAAALSAPRLSERELRRGAGLPAVAGFDPALGAAVVTLDRPGVFRLADVAGIAPGLRGSGVPGSPLVAVGAKEGGVLSAPGDRFWLVREGKGADLKNVKADRIIIASGLDAGAQFPVPEGNAVTADLGEGAKGVGGPVLALVTSPSGQPGVKVGESGEEGKATAAEPAATQMAVGPRTAMAVSLAPKRAVARVWQAGRSTSESAGAVEEMRLAQLRFPAPSVVKAGWGVLDGKLEGITARQLTLPSGARKLRVSLGEGTVAVLSRGDTVVGTLWQGGAPFEERLEDDAADRLTLLHTRPGADPFSVELLPRAEGEDLLALPAGAPFERALDRAGTLRITLPTLSGASPPATTFHVRGAGAQAVLLGRDGSVARGADVPVGRGGVLLIQHGPGLLLAWLGAAGEETAALWPAADRGAQPVKVEPPASVPLSGRFADLAIAGSGPRVLHLRTAEPVATLLHRADGSADEVEVHRESGRLDAFLPPGDARLGLRSLAGAQLSGVAEITLTPVTAIREGLGPEVLLPAGGSRWFSFHVDRQGPVGVGAHADSDVVEIELYDRGGRRLEAEGSGDGVGAKGGVVRLSDLAPGDYLLALRSPAGAAPVKARPAVAGLVLPDTGPPEDVIRQYLQEAGAEAPESVPGSEP
ncbi:MAG TPA: hypothetical protein VH988_27775 [Thermoanaerobaculia bacterium]|jgi:hypothetical protein|nr:hypothetical protein [Thermoanaerobaculia bacterium]